MGKTIQDEFPELPLGGLQIVQVATFQKVDASIKIVLHKKQCHHDGVVPDSLDRAMLAAIGNLPEPHWVEVKSGQAFVDWHHNLYEHTMRRPSNHGSITVETNQSGLFRIS